LSEKEAKKIPKNERRYLSYIGNGRYIVEQGAGRYVNHSCDSNTYVKDEKDIAKRDIKKGEEITSDYSLEGVAEMNFKCNCGSKNCRKIIYGDFSRLDAKTRKKLEPYLQDWVKKEVLGY